MVTQIRNADPSQTKTLKIESTSLIPNVLPSISIGDILKVTVRQNPADGPGLIYFKGLLVKAQLPPNVAPGDKLTAKVTEEGDQIQFKIVELQKGITLGIASEEIPQLEADLEELIRSTGTGNLRGLNTFQLSETLKGISAFQGRLESLLAPIKSNELLADAKAAFEQLLGAADGDLGASLKESAKSLRDFIESHAESDAGKQLRLLKQELGKVFQTIAEDNSLAAYHLDELLESYERDAKVLKRFDNGEQEQVKATMRNLRSMRAGKPDQGPDELKAELQSAFRPLDRLNPDIKDRVLDPKAAQELTQLATKLDQMAATQEALSRMNPIMQALGEPAIILFPFIIQGLISHSEVTVETKQLGKKKGERDILDENDGEGGKKSETFQRVQVSVPLPALGTIDVDIAHRPKEILVRLNVEDKAIGAFITEHLEDLAAQLRNHGFSKTELMANVGVKKGDEAADWSMSLHAATSIIA